MRHLHHQTSQTKLWAVIPAAGSGSRFSKTELKQYQYIQDATVIEHTVKRLSQLPLTGYVLVENKIFLPQLYLFKISIKPIFVMVALNVCIRY